MELNSEHPIAKGIISKGEEQNADRMEVADYQNLTGKGLGAKVDGRNIKIVSPAVGAVLMSLSTVTVSINARLLKIA